MEVLCEKHYRGNAVTEGLEYKSPPKAGFSDMNRYCKHRRLLYSGVSSLMGYLNLFELYHDEV